MTNQKNPLHQHLPKLATLNIIVEAGSYRSASAKAHVTQSALSQTVTVLETVLGFPLLIRDSGRVRATKSCELLLERVRPILKSLDLLSQDMSPEKNNIPAIGRLDLGCFESLAIDIVPALVNRLQQIYPQLHLTLRTGRSDDLVKLVRKGELCMAITTELDTLAGLTVLQLAKDRFGVFVSSKFRFAGSGKDTLDTLRLGSLTPAKDGHPRYYARFMRSLKLKTPSIACESFEVLRAMAVEGVIAAVLPTRVALQRGYGDLVELDLGASAKAGTHDILLISQKNCDHEENDFLANELRVLFRA